MWATVITDASFCPNTRAAGWGAWVTLDDGRRLKHSGRFRNTPSGVNEAELWAALNGIHIAHHAGALNVLVQTDCAHVVRLFQQGLVDVGSRPPNGVVESKHVKGHTTKGEARYWVNRWCDANARRHMIKWRKELSVESDIP